MTRNVAAGQLTIYMIMMRKSQGKLHTSRVHVSSSSKDTMGLPPDSSSTLFWGRNRATTLMLLFALDMLTAGSPQ